MSADDLTTHLLTLLHDGPIDSTEGLVVHGRPVDPQTLQGVLSGLTARQMVTYSTQDRDVWQLTTEGSQLADSGSHEVRVFQAVPADGVAVEDLHQRLGSTCEIGLGVAFKNKWLGRNAQGRVVRVVDAVDDHTQQDLCRIRNGDTLPEPAALLLLRRRKLCTKTKVSSYRVERGEKYAATVTRQATDLTADMLATGAWAHMDFKKYNLDALGLKPLGGHLHPLMKVRSEFRKIFFEMGFEEMPTNQFVESSFWNFDALFQPQQHPARDMQDTFFLASPASSPQLPQALVERVSRVHSEGGHGSVGYQYVWERTEAEKLVLRTHTTAVSARMLYRLAQTGFRPAKYFSIDRVFRNETLDATHLAEFHQVEGLIADADLTLADLMGVLTVFCEKMGVQKLRLKPTYNPYTEPSMELFAFHEGLQRWVEIGNSGMFRPEVLLPLGLPENVRVLAWGLSLERPTMIKYNIDDIRSLLGHKCDLDMIASNPICRLDQAMGAVDLQ